MSHSERYQYPISFFLTAAKSWLNYGVETDTILSLSGIDARKFENPDATVSVDEIRRLLAASRQLNRTGIPESILVAEQFSFTNVGLLGLAVTASENLGSVLELLTRFLSTFAPGLSIDYRVHADDLYVDYSIDEDFEDALPFFNEVVVCVMQRFSELFQDNLTPSLVYFSHTPLYPIEVFEQYLGCPVQTNHHVNRLSFPVKNLDTPLKHADRSTSAIIEKQLQSTLGIEQPENSWIKKICSVWHIHAERQHFLTQKQMADELNISPRTLVRRLAEENSNYRTLVQQWRLEKAKAILKQTDQPISEIALKVGFDDESAFFRFFKNSVGITPRHYRIS